METDIQPITPDEAMLLRKVLTGNYEGKEAKATQNSHLMQGAFDPFNLDARLMVKRGLLLRGEPVGCRGAHYIHATEAGAKAVGIELPKEMR